MPRPRRPGPGLRAGLSGWVVVVVALATVGLVPSPAAAQIEGLEVDATTTYHLDPTAGVVRATVEAHLTNTMPSRRRGAYIETPYFDAFAFPALGPVTEARARSSAGRDLSVVVEPADEGISVLVVDLSPNLVHGSPQSVTIEFDLPGQPSRSEAVTRVNEAFASWFIFGVGDPGRIDIVVDVPESFEVTLTTGLSLATSQHEGRRVYRADDVTREEDAALFATARYDDRLDSRALVVSARDITVKAWPSDPEWADFAADTIQRGVPVLEDLVGQDLPDRDLTVIESTGSYHLGYAGFYDPTRDLIEVGDELDRQVVLHELSHIWLNRRLFTDRWVYEGLADEVANRATEQLGDPPIPPDPIDPQGEGALALNEWSVGLTLDPIAFEVERFAYNASYAVVHDLVEDIGVDGLRAVLAAATEQEIAHRGDPEPERSPIRDWRYFYDLLEFVGGSERAHDLFVAHVVTDEQAAQLARRADALVALDDLVAAAGGWTAPQDVREEMARWGFDGAERLMGQARRLLDRVRELRASLRPVGIDPGAALEVDYEGAANLDQLDQTLKRFEQVGTELLTLHQRRQAAGPIASLGLVGTGDSLSQATASYERGELDDAATALERASVTTDGATERGAALLVAFVLLIGTTTAHVRLRRA